ncbi:hypothetical protein Bca101_024513 [Brassica carinata]
MSSRHCGSNVGPKGGRIRGGKTECEAKREIDTAEFIGKRLILLSFSAFYFQLVFLENFDVSCSSWLKDSLSTW